jgi:hypothetical protein
MTRLAEAGSGAAAGATMTRVLAVVLSLLLVAGGVHAAPAVESTKRSLAVLEFRGGATGARNIGQRVAQLLRQRTSHPIIDGTDARRIASARIDDQVARCSGEASCIGAIGRRLGVEAVLLVGVSEFGDLILNLQLVDSAGGKVEARVADSLPRDAEPDDAALEGYLKRLLPPADFVRWGTLRIESNVAGADVFVGGDKRGQTPLAPIPLQAPRAVDLRVSKEGFIDFRARIDVVPDAAVEVRPVLTPRPGSSWYEKWWVWAIAGVVVAGGVTTAVVLSQPAPRTVPIDVHF